MSEPDKLIASLASHPAWEHLKARGKERLDREFHRITHEFIVANKAPDYADLQWRRGVFAGIKFLLDQPDMDAGKLEKLLAQERGEA